MRSLMATFLVSGRYEDFGSHKMDAVNTEQYKKQTLNLRE